MNICARASSVTWQVFVILTPVPAVAEHGVTRIADFGTTIQTDQGGFFRCFGGRPDEIADRLTRLGQPATDAWHIQVGDGAAHHVGVLVPLFDETGAVKNVPSDIKNEQELVLRLTGLLGQRRLRIEIVKSRNPAAAGTRIGTVAPSQLDTRVWREVRLPLSTKRVDVNQVGFIRVVAEGEGAAWFSIDLMAFASVGRPPVVSKQPPRAGRRLKKALWVWNTDEILPDKWQVDRLLAFCTQHNVSNLFCQIPYSYDAGIVRLSLADAQRQFNAAANARGIVVHALDGAPEYTLPANHQRMTQLLDALGQYNARATPPERYPSIHLDNEPYLLEGWQESSRRGQILADYVDLFRKLDTQADALGMEVGVDIPFWWDERDPQGNPIYTVATAGGPQPLLDALFPLVKHVGIMSYRDRVTGPNGVVRHCMEEFRLGSEYGNNVYAAVELGTGEDVEQGTSFGPYPYEYFRNQLETLNRVLSSIPGCAGIAIHYYKPYAQLAGRP